MTFTRTHDMRLVKNIATLPVIWRAAADDFAGKPDDFVPVDYADIWYVVAKDQEGIIGIFILHKKSVILWDIHLCILPESWGPRAKQAGRGILQWIWDNTSCRRLVGEIPSCNLHAIAFAKSVGMTVYGCNPDGFMKDGLLVPIVMLGVTRPWPS